MNCPKCDAEMEKEDRVDRYNIEYQFYVCPECSYEFEDVGDDDCE